MKRHSLKRQRTSHQVRRHDLLCVDCNVMTSYVKVLKWCVSLRRMLVCCRELYVSQEFSVISMLDRGGDADAAFLLLRHALMKHSEVELWTAEMLFQYNVRLMNNIRLWIFLVTGWTASSRHLYCLWNEMLLLQRFLMQHFSSSVHHLPHLQPGQRTFIISSLVPPKTSTSRLQLKLWFVIDNISSRLRETV